MTSAEWWNEPRHDKTNKVTVRPAKTQFSLGIRTVWSESSLSAWRNLGPLATRWAHSEDSDQTGQMPRSAQSDLSHRWAHTHFVGIVMSRLKCFRTSHWHCRGRLFSLIIIIKSCSFWKTKCSRTHYSWIIFTPFHKSLINMSYSNYFEQITIDISKHHKWSKQSNTI